MLDRYMKFYEVNKKPNIYQNILKNVICLKNDIINNH